MSHIPRLTLIGIYNYDPTLFDDMDFPEGIDKEVAINSLLLSIGEKPVSYMDPAFMKAAITLWARKWYNSIERIYNAMDASYNPVHNFDRYEDYTDKASAETSSTNTSSTEGKISAFNESTYQPDNKSDSNGSASGETSSNIEHKGHLYGNIGVTTSQQMILAELGLREANNIYDVIAALFAKDLLLYIW